LVASLVHPERKASVWGVRFNKDGSRLFTAGYPSGVVQTWDPVARKEVQRVETPPVFRSSANYAILSPDWKTLYVPIEKRKAAHIEKDGKKASYAAFDGEVRVWDLTTGKPLPPLRADPPRGVVHAELSPDGRTLLTNESATDAAIPYGRRGTYLWDLRDGGCRKLCDDFGNVAFLPGGRAAGSVYDPEARKTDVRLVELATGKELAKLAPSAKDGSYWVRTATPDGRRVVVSQAGGKGQPPKLLLLDAGDLKEVARFEGRAAQNEANSSLFCLLTPDGRRLAADDHEGGVYVWDLDTRQLVWARQLGAKAGLWQMALSPDGRRLAVGGQEMPDAPERDSDDPADQPQPRVYLFDLATGAGPEMLVCPHGYRGGLAFSPDGKLLAVGGAGATHLFDVSRTPAKK
jgi:WD40 repeat protein